MGAVKTAPLLVLMVLAIPLLACGLLNSILPSAGKPAIIHGSIVIQGSGVWALCSEPIPGFSCTGTTTVTALPSPDDFTVQYDGSGNIVSGQATVNIDLDFEYQFVFPPCSGPYSATYTTDYNGTIPLAAKGGPGVTDAIFYGPLTQGAKAQIEASCPDAPGSGSGSGSALFPPMDNVSLELVGLHPTIAVGTKGKCIFSALDAMSGMLKSFQPTCTYQIEEVVPLLPVHPTQAP